MQILNSPIWLVQLLLKMLRSHFTAGRFPSSHVTSPTTKAEDRLTTTVGGDPPDYSQDPHTNHG